MNQWTPKTTLIVAGVAVLGLWYLKSKSEQAIKDAGQAVNPINPDNIFNRAFNELYQGATGSQSTLGSDLYDFFHGEEEWD